MDEIKVQIKKWERIARSEPVSTRLDRQIAEVLGVTLQGPIGRAMVRRAVRFL